MKNLQGYKTYLLALFGVIYGWGIQKGLWPHEPTFDYLLAGGALASMRHGLKTEVAKLITAALTDPPELPSAPRAAAAPTVNASSSPGAAGKPILSLFAFIFLVGATVFGLTACQSGRLESGGAYAPLVTNTVAGTNAITAQPDMAFYIADAAYQTGWSAVNAAFDFEFNNRATLWKVSPQIKEQLDLIRPDAVKANADYLAARAVYIANPIPPNLDLLQQVLARLQQVSTAAQALLPKGN